jgi:hypothetical protein
VVALQISTFEALRADVKLAKDNAPGTAAEVCELAMGAH